MKKKKGRRESIPLPSCVLTEEEERILRVQIKRNGLAIDALIKKIDLLANRERCPKDANTLLRLRKQFSVETEENDTFRKVLWKHLRAQAHWKTVPTGLPDPVTFLVGQINSRRKSLIAQACMK